PPDTPPAGNAPPDNTPADNTPPGNTSPGNTSPGNTSPGDTTPGADPPGLTFACQVLRVAALAVFLVTILVALLAGLPAPPARRLPGSGAASAHFVLLLALAVFLLVATAVLARMDRPHAPVDPIDRRALGGMASWFVLMVAAAAASVLSLGVMFWTAAFFGVPESPANPGPTDRRLYLMDPLWWAAALVPVLLLAALCVAGALWLIRRRTAERLESELAGHYRDSSERVAEIWALAALTDRAGLALGLLTGVGLAGLAAVIAIYRFTDSSVKEGVAGMLATIGGWAVAAVVVGLVLLGRRAYSDSRLRRTIGILWDVSTFWPRAIHPLAPPCYTERVIPELIARVRRLADDPGERVVLSGHSQGSVIAAALVLQLDPSLTARIGMLTHGSPLRRLYAAFFPAYFGTRALTAVRDTVDWVNLYRLSDPIGGPVFGCADAFGPKSPPDGRPPVDRFCWDPPPPRPGRPLGAARWHSDYWLDPAYHTALSHLGRRC
ncbi:hypothetical protein HII36_31720, partial [Nonomuraea sp. NN258]|nr:hypothetical protein [Nonomuraea antri]